MISRYLEYAQPLVKEEVLAAGEKTIIVFSRLEEVVTLDSEKINKLSQIFELLQEKAEDEDDDEKETLYGPLVDAFEEENYFTHDENRSVHPRNLKIAELKNMPDEKAVPFGDTYSNETLIAFGYLNSKDLYLTPEDLTMLAADLTWFVNKSGRCKKETSLFVRDLIKLIERELRFIEEEKPHVNLFVFGL